MKPYRFRRLLPGLMLLVLAGPAAAQTPPPAPPAPFVPGPWWRDARKTQLALTDEQSKRIDAIILAAMGPNPRQRGEELRALEAELSRMIVTDLDETAIARQVDRVEAFRAMLNKNRTLMLVHIRAVLTPEQRVKLATLREQWEKENQPPRQGDNRDRRPPTQRQDSPKSPR
jgi:Spy/CpxP family protein refolding chaperone